MIRDKIVVVICNSTLSEKLQLDSRLTLESAIAQVRHSESVKQQQSLLRRKPDTPVGAVYKIRGETSPAKFNQARCEGTTQLCVQPRTKSATFAINADTLEQFADLQLVCGRYRTVLKVLPKPS